jgi:CubicO group peptidase (beta-lactamase class C family)
MARHHERQGNGPMVEITRRDLLTGSLVTLGAGLADGAAPALAKLPPAAEGTPAEHAAMAAAAKAFIQTYDVPGLSVAIARAGNLVYAEAFGVADRKPHTPLTPDHRFRIASVTKPITSATIFALIEKRRLDLQDQVVGPGGILGTIYGAPPYKRWITDIRIEHLLTHTGGGWPNDNTDPMFSHPQMDHRQLITWTLANLELTHRPGTHYAYSNFGYCVLGRVIEKLTGKPYWSHVSEAVLERCGIGDMRLAGNTLAERKPSEVVYYGQGGDDPYAWNVTRMDSHGGWIARPTDLVRFATHVDDFPAPPDILTAQTIKTMTTGTAANPGYAKGWQVNTSHNWWHAGSLPGSTTIAVRTHSGFCWAAFANTRRENSNMDGDLDTLIWTMVGKVATWHA